MPTTKAFVDKLVKRLERVDSRQLGDMLHKLAREKDFFEVVINNLDSGVVVTDPQLIILYINAAARQQPLILPRKSYVGKTLVNVMPAGKFTDFLANELFADGRPMRQELALKEPEPAIFSISAYPVRDEESHQLHSIVFILRDITAARCEQEQQRRMERMSSLTTLTAGVAHDIRNPLNALNINAQMLRGMVQKAQNENAPLDLKRLDKTSGVLMEELERLADIVDRFLDSVRPTSPDLKPVSLNRAVEHVLDVIRPECEAARVALETALDPDVPPMPLDERQIGQAVLNLLKNALESIGPEGGRIAIRTRLEDRWIHLDVEDTGCGIARDKLATIFEPYYTTKFSGAGLGLMNVFRIVREHLGEIHVDSEPGKGSHFTFSLPLDQKPIRLLAEPMAEKEVPPAGRDLDSDNEF